MPTSSDSRSIAAHDLVAYGGGLFGAGVLLYQAWIGVSIEHVLSSAATSGLMAYLILAVGFAAARSIVTAASDSDSPEETPDGSPEESATESEENHDQTAPEPQAA
jgi:hypothetical protein